VRSSTSRYDDRRRIARWTILPALIAIVVAVALPASASAAPCPVNPGNATAWIGGSGNFGDSANWSNGTPTAACDVSITKTGSYTVNMTSGANTKSFTLGGPGSTPNLVISVQGPNTNLDAQPSGITIAAGASVTLTCPPSPGECVGGSGGGAHIYSGSSPFVNAGTITVDPNSGTGAEVGGVITNTGTIAFENSGGTPYSASLGGKVTNQGVITVGNGGNVVNQGSSCGGTEPFVKNDAGGTISGTGTGVLSVINFEQGDGTTEDVVIPCGSLKYSGSGASEVGAFGGFNLTGEMKANQSLTVSANSNNTNAVLQGDFTNKGSITLTCPEGGCSGSGGGSGGGAGFNANGHVFTNAGTFTFAAKSGTDAGTSGGMTNTGTIQFDQSGFFSGVVTNNGTISIANGKVATSSTGHCGDSGPRVINDTGGKIVGVGTGTLSAVNFEQGAGTTAGTAPVTMNCGSLKYVGTGASTVRVPTSATMTGNLAAGQTIVIAGQLNHGAFTNAGTIVLDQSTGSPTLNSGTVTNAGRIEASGASANTSSVNGQIDQTGAGAEVVVPAGTKLQLGNTLLLKAGTLRGSGTVSGSVENTGGVVKPGESPGTLTLTGNYLQGAGGRIEIEVAGTGVGQYDRLALGGSATLGGTLALNPTAGFAESSAVGNNIPFLTYGSSVAGGFSTTTVTPALSCGKAFAVSTEEGAKALKATVVAGGTACGGGSGGSGGGAAPPISPPPPTPKKTCPKGKQLKQGKCVVKKCPKGKKLKRGRCVKKKQPKAKASHRRS
jgi:fibronectin-binding autotransporter adhesin